MGAVEKRRAKTVAACLVSVFWVGCVSQSKHDELLKRNERTEQQLAAATQAKARAEERIAELETLIANLEKRLGAESSDKENMRASIEQMKSALQEASARKKEAEKRIAEYSDLVRRFQGFIDAGELSIKIVDGRMVVALPSDVLFPSGSATLSEKGQATIQKVTKLLASIQGRSFQVEGHTDNVPIKTAQYPSNWELAAARATNVVKRMVESGMPPHRVSAAAFADTRPVKDNSSKEARELNRRIEIVVVPDLSRLPGYDELKNFDSKHQAKD